MEEEIWKEMLGYEGIYDVSNLGHVYSHVTHKMLKNLKGAKDYICVSLTKNSVNKKVRLHRIVAVNFIPNPSNLPQVNHKDEDKHNNCADNLEWCDNTYNSNYGTKKERASKTLMGHMQSEETKLKISKANTGKEGLKGSKNLRSKPVLQYDLQGNLLSRYESINMAVRITGIHISGIIGCCKLKYKSFKNFIWKYESRP